MWLLFVSFLFLVLFALAPVAGLGVVAALLPVYVYFLADRLRLSPYLPIATCGVVGGVFVNRLTGNPVMAGISGVAWLIAGALAFKAGTARKDRRVADQRNAEDSFSRQEVARDSDIDGAIGG
jgi:hypothetical protein